MNFIKILQKPHPFIYNGYSIIVPGVISFLIIATFAPFGVSEFPFHYRILMAGIFGVIGSAGVVIMVNVLKYVAPAFMREERWTLGKEVILVVLVIGGICLIIFFVFLATGTSDSGIWDLFKRVVVNTLVISVLPVTVMILFEQYFHQKQKLEQANLLNKKLITLKPDQQYQKTEVQSPPKLILFKAENGKIELQLKPEEVLYLKSGGNYVEIFYQTENGHLQKKLVRNRLKAFTKMLSKSLFFQCHKSYVVNGNHIVSVEGNARNYELILRGAEERIPVSRAKSEALSAFLISG